LFWLFWGLGLGFFIVFLFCGSCGFCGGWGLFGCGFGLGFVFFIFVFLFFFFFFVFVSSHAVCGAFQRVFGLCCFVRVYGLLGLSLLCVFFFWLRVWCLSAPLLCHAGKGSGGLLGGRRGCVAKGGGGVGGEIQAGKRGCGGGPSGIGGAEWGWGTGKQKK